MRLRRGKSFEGLAEQSNVGKHLDENIYEFIRPAFGIRLEELDGRPGPKLPDQRPSTKLSIKW